MVPCHGAFGAQRTLLPAPPNLVRASERPPPKRTKVSAACGECRAHKTKCNGARPICQACVSRASACEYLATNSSQIKQRVRDSDELLHLMRSLPEVDAMSILRHVRAGANCETVVRHIKEGSLLMQLSVAPETRRRYELPYLPEVPASLLTPDNPYISSTILNTKLDLHGTLERSWRTKPYRAAVTSDPLIEKVTIGVWTAVISDNRLLRKLLSTFFQFAYTEWFPFHKDLFLSDMAANRTRFCSSLLVNAVLANASYSFSALPDRAKYWLPENLTYRFTAEAKRLWDLEITSGRRTLTTVQASQILSVIMDFDGIDTLGKQFTARGLGMAHELDIFGSDQMIHDEETRKARTWTAWSLFAWHSMISYYYHERPRIALPPQNPLPEDPAWYGVVCLHYPPSSVIFPMQLCHTFRAKCQLRGIKHAIAARAFGEANTRSDAWLTYEEASSFFTKLIAWFEALPGHLKPSSLLFPKDMGIHLEYLNIVTDLLGPHVSRNIGSGTTISQSSYRVDNEPPAIVVLNANRQKETLLRLYFIRHSFDDFDPMVVNFIIERLGASLSELSISDSSVLSQRLLKNEVLRSTMILCAMGLRSQAKSYHVCNLAYYGLQSQMRPEDLQLLLTYVKPPVETDMPPLDHDVVTSWPLPIISMGEDPKKSALNKMFKDYEHSKTETSGGVNSSQACPLSAICN